MDGDWYRAVIPRDPIATQGDQPEEHDAADEQGVDMVLRPSGVCCGSDAGHMAVSNPDDLPHRPPQSQKLKSKETHCDRSQRRSDQSNESSIRGEAAREPEAGYSRADGIEG